ncbi:MAG: DUF4595 domain-containing protein [Bacteroidaceae bacterium]|nr:DUF4595 domain-containing protein [Bacteroidaceae bacterium]
MKQRFTWMLAAIPTLCGITMLTSCSDYEDDTVEVNTMTEIISYDYFSGGSTTPISHITYSYDEQGRCIRAEETDASNNISTTTFTYENGQITETEVRYVGTKEVTYRSTYTLDETGLITSLNYIISSLDDMETVTETAYDYDAQGHIIRIINNLQKSTPDTTFLTWQGGDIVKKEYCSTSEKLTSTSTAKYTYGDVLFQFCPSDYIELDGLLLRAGYFGTPPVHQLLSRQYSNVIESATQTQSIHVTNTFEYQLDTAGRIISYTNHETSTVNGGVPTEGIDRYNVGWMEFVFPKVKD